ncbi:MAG: hypothetical protein P4L50_20255 [Anaerolineaceae bacterium]|nr:hypothetical protein [Anaerolineaceae bacterium]
MEIRKLFARKSFRIVLLFLVGPVLPAVAGIHWVSPTGTASYANCVGSAPLAGTSACSLATANNNAVAGDLVYFVTGIYDGGGLGIAIQPKNSGTSSSSMITFMAYSGETVTMQNWENGFWLPGNSYISIKNLNFSGTFSRMWGSIDNGGNHNEIAYNTFTGVLTSTTNGSRISITGASNMNWATHNWIHNNHFQNSGTGCTDGGTDTIDIGISEGSYGNAADNDNNNTVENNFFEHAQHANWDNYGMYSVFRNNVVHNEPWSVGNCSPNPYLPDYSTGSAVWSSSTTYGVGATVTSGGNFYVSLHAAELNLSVSDSSNWTNVGAFTQPDFTGLVGNYGHRNFQITEDYNRTGTFVLVEGNRSGFAGVNQSNDGADDFSLAAPQNIVRYNFFYAGMNPGLMFKYNWQSGLNGGGHGGTYNRVYNNTFYANGYGYPLGLTKGCNVGSSTCPFTQTAISLYSAPSGGICTVGGTCSGEGNALKNNLIYSSAGYTVFGSDLLEKGSPSNGWAEVWYALNNWCTGPQKGGNTDFHGNAGCSATGNPLFNNPDLSNPASQTLPDLSLQATSPAIDGGTYLTTATSSGKNSTILTVADALYFQDGTWGSDLSRPVACLGGTMQADWIAIGAVTNVVQISSVTYGTYNDPAGTITLASPMSWSKGAPIWLYRKSDGSIVLVGAAPDYGASEYGASTPAQPGCVKAVVN